MILEKSSAQVHEHRRIQGIHRLNLAESSLKDMIVRFEKLSASYQGQQSIIGTLKNANHQMEKQFCEMQRIIKQQSNKILGGTKTNKVMIQQNRPLANRFKVAEKRASRYTKQMQENLTQKKKLLKRMHESHGMLKSQMHTTVKENKPFHSKVMHRNISTQTNAGEDGLWEIESKQKFCKVSKLSSTMFKKTLRFLLCPRCKGGKNLKHKAYDASVVHMKSVDIRKKPRKNGVWMMSQYFQRFLRNLPQSIQARPVKPLSWLNDEIEYILDKKIIVDMKDDQINARLQTLSEFIIDEMLNKYGNRYQAEIAIFELLMSIKKYIKHPKILFFARFLDLVHDKDSKLYAINKEANLFMIGWIRWVIKSNVVGVLNNVSNVTWVPLGDIIKILRSSCFFLPFSKVQMFSHTLEKRSGIWDPQSHVLSPPSIGNHHITRNVIRATILELNRRDNFKEDGLVPETVENAIIHQADNDGLSQQDETCYPVVDLYVALNIIIRVLALRRRNIEDRLLLEYLNATKGDGGNLSIDDFADIFELCDHDIEPRKLTHMYRDALCYKGIGATNITREAFLSVCGQYNIVPFVSIEELKSAFSKYGVKI